MEFSYSLTLWTCVYPHLCYGLVRFVEVWVERFFLPVLLCGHPASGAVEMSQAIPVLFSLACLFFSRSLCLVPGVLKVHLGMPGADFLRSHCWAGRSLRAGDDCSACGTFVHLSATELPSGFCSLLNSCETGVGFHQLTL